MRRRGFSMVEIAFVVVIIGVVAAIAAPRYASAVQRYRVWSAAQRLHGDLQQAREWARASGVPHEVRFDAGNESYAIVRVPASGPEVVRAKVSLAASPYDAEIGRARFQASQAEVDFDAYGRLASGAKIYITSNAWSVPVLADPTSGEITLGELEPASQRGAVVLAAANTKS
jgi:type II secretion system protein H